MTKLDIELERMKEATAKTLMGAYYRAMDKLNRNAELTEAEANAGRTFKDGKHSEGVSVTVTLKKFKGKKK